MVNYLYRCVERHETAESAPIGEAPDRVDCRCGRVAGRVPTAPMLATTNNAYSEVVETAAASAENPAVVSRPPSRRRAQPRGADPRHLRLPRP